MCDVKKTIQQTPTPLNTLYFSDFNQQLVQRAIRQMFRNETGISIDYQNKDDLYSLMRVVFINHAQDHHKNIHIQVRSMNTMVIETAISQIRSGVSQYMGYIKDIDTLAVPPEPPSNTSTYGMKIDKNDKIGI
jgi:hypothetical protein